MGAGTFYKLYPDPEACLAEAFKRCAKTVLGRVEDAAAGEEGDFVSRLTTGLHELLDLLSSHPDVARLILVGAKGYEAAHVKDVPKRAGLSWPLFSAHFSGKEDCMLAAFDTAISPIEERVRAAVASGASATGRVEAGMPLGKQTRRTRWWEW